jgi:hypothetical protein
VSKLSKAKEGKTGRRGRPRKAVAAKSMKATREADQSEEDDEADEEEPVPKSSKAKGKQVVGKGKTALADELEGDDDAEEGRTNGGKEKPALAKSTKATKATRRQPARGAKINTKVNAEAEAEGSSAATKKRKREKLNPDPIHLSARNTQSDMLLVHSARLGHYFRKVISQSYTHFESSNATTLASYAQDPSCIYQCARTLQSK